MNDGDDAMRGEGQCSTVGLRVRSRSSASAARGGDVAAPYRRRRRPLKLARGVLSRPLCFKPSRHFHYSHAHHHPLYYYQQRPLLKRYLQHHHHFIPHILYNAMSHIPSLSTPNATPKRAKRQGMVFLRPFTWAECPSPRESPLYFSPASSHSRTSSAPSSSTSAPLTVSARSASPSGSRATSPRVHRAPTALDTRAGALPPSIITFAPPASIPKRSPLPRAWCGENASEPKRPYGLPNPFSAAALSPPQPHPFSAAAIACHVRNPYPREVSGRPTVTVSTASTTSSISSICSTYSGYSLLSHPSASSPSPRLDDRPAPLLPLPTLTDLAMVARTPFLELGMSPTLIIR